MTLAYDNASAHLNESWVCRLWNEVHHPFFTTILPPLTFSFFNTIADTSTKICFFDLAYPCNFRTAYNKINCLFLFFILKVLFRATSSIDVYFFEIRSWGDCKITVIIALVPFSEWCKANYLIIQLRKSFVMFLSQKETFSGNHLWHWVIGVEQELDSKKKK